MPLCVGFVVGKVTVEQGFLQVISPAPANIISLKLHTRIYLYATLIRRTTARNQDTFNKALLFRKLAALEMFFMNVSLQSINLLAD